MATPKDSQADRKNELPPELSLAGLRRKQASPLNDQVWHLLLFVFGGCALGWAVPAVFGLKAALGIWLSAFLSIISWVAAIRLLLLESRAKIFWLIWLCLGLAPLLATRSSTGSDVGIGFSFVFLLFRRYRPYRHLSGRRQNWLFLIGILIFFLLTILWPAIQVAQKADVPQASAQLPAASGGSSLLTSGQAFLQYGLGSLRLFWFFSLFNLFFSIRLHFMRLKPKLAVSAFLIAVFPVFLVAVMGIVALYGLLGESRALRASAVLQDWAGLAVRDTSFIPTISESHFLHQKNEDGSERMDFKGERPLWFEEFLTALRSEKLSLPGISPQETALFFLIKGETWLMDLSRFDDSPSRLGGCKVGSAMLDRLSTILNCEVVLFQANPIDLFPSLGKAQPAGNLDEKQIKEALKERLEEQQARKRKAETGPPPPRPPLWKRTLYFGMSHLDVIILDNGKFGKSNILIAAKGSLSQIFGELLSTQNPLTRIFFSLLVCIAFFLLILEAAALFFGVRITSGITQAVKFLHRGTRRIASGDLETPIEIPNEDELGDLAFSFNQMAAAVKKGREEAIARGVLERELETARQIQQRLLPHKMPYLPGFEICGMSLPSRRVGGDYFDFIETEAGELGIAIGDVSGKGMPAALLMANVQASLHAQVIKTGVTSELVSRMNNLLVQSTDANMFVTFFYGYLNRAKSSLTWTNAGHNPPLLFRSKGQVERLESGGLMLGFLSDQSYPQKETSIQQGDILILYTDGITEASAFSEGGRKERFGDQRLMDTVLACRAQAAVEIQAAILKAVSSFTADTPQEDDITLVVIKRAAPESGN